MSVCRRASGDSDCYVYEIANSPWTYSCCDCSLQQPDPWGLRGWRMALHLLRHRLHGHRVPFYAFRRLWRDAREKR